MNTTRVNGIVKAQYTQNLLVIICGPPQSSDGTAKSAAKKVPGRKTIVMIAMVFIEPLSRLAASACRFEIRAKICVVEGYSKSLLEYLKSIMAEILTVSDCALTRLSTSLASTLKFQIFFLVEFNDWTMDE